ncbi:MAG TPA: hypothetical protein VKB51_15870 [bacterium]|nr:hypothetical protein [bacterium]
MAWNELTFVECSVLTADKMTRLQGNFAALAAGESGAPPLHIDAVSSLATVHAASGFLGPAVSSLGTLHVGSGLLAPQVSSLGTLQVGSGIAAPGVNSLGTVVTQHGLATTLVTSVGYGNTETVIASLGLAVTGALRLRFDAAFFSGLNGRQATYGIRVGSAGGTVVASFSSLSLLVSGNMEAIAFHAYHSPAAGGTQAFVLTARNRFDTVVLHAIGVRFSVMETHIGV